MGLNGRVVVLRTSANPVSTPVLPIWFEIHTKAGLPVNTPVPPRTCVLRSLNTSQLKPTRGDHSGLASGSFFVAYCTVAPVSSRKLMASATALAKPVSPKLAMSMRTPAITFTLSAMAHSSWTYPPE